MQKQKPAAENVKIMCKTENKPKKRFLSTLFHRACVSFVFSIYKQKNHKKLIKRKEHFIILVRILFYLWSNRVIVLPKSYNIYIHCISFNSKHS